MSETSVLTSLAIGSEVMLTLRRLSVWPALVAVHSTGDFVTKAVG